MSDFRTSFGENIFRNKYAKERNINWADLAKMLVDDVCGTAKGTKEPLLPKDTLDEIERDIREMKFIPGGRYLYYGGRESHAWNNCFLLRGEEDTREEWGNIDKRASDCLMSGGGIGIEYSRFRKKNMVLSKTGGMSSGPIPLMYTINELGRNVMQGGSRRSAIWAGLNWQHGDVMEFLNSKNWQDMPIGKAKKKDGSPYTVWDAKQDDFNYPAPLDMTNISLNYDDKFLHSVQTDGLPEIFLKNVLQALSTGEPGFGFNFGSQSLEDLRNACTEVTSEDDSDCCNLASMNMPKFSNKQELYQASVRASMFLVCGTLRADLPYAKVYDVRLKNRRLGLGLMGMHEWLLQRGQRYEVTPDLHKWLEQYEMGSEIGANSLCDKLGISRPVAYRAIAPTGTIGILAGTTTGIEPLFATAYKRRYLSDGTKWRYEYVVDATAAYMVNTLGVSPENIETAVDLAADPERRIKFQADVQDYVDMAISSTINLPPWGSPLNNVDTVADFAILLAKYAPRLRGFTCYPDGARGGQPLVQVPYNEALKHKGVVFDEVDICEWTGKGGTCGS